MDFEKEEYTPMIDTKKPKPKLGAKAGNTQEFSSLNGVNVKDKAAREDMEELAEYIGTLPPEPWQPLEDGYSNFWFELTNDTLSPWLNFSAKTDSAVIDWGDGSGEVALDTLTPTHTYSKPGRYIIKVKGVTGIEAQNGLPRNNYSLVMKYVELNSEVTVLINNAFKHCAGLTKIVIHGTVSMGNYVFYGCTSLESIQGYNGNATGSSFYLCTNLKEYTFGNTATNISGSAFYFCNRMTSIVLPASISYIGAYSFRLCESLNEIHVQATTPPTCYDTAFTSIMPNYIIYVPVGTGETYKAASGWSTYADHILEEGQVRNRAMLANFNDEPEDDEPEETR